MSEDDWKLKAACRGCGPDLFFAHPGESVTAERAKRICSTCSVTKECLEEWMMLPYEQKFYGIWGGMTQRDRKQKDSQVREIGYGIRKRA